MLLVVSGSRFGRPQAPRPGQFNLGRYLHERSILRSARPRRPRCLPDGARRPDSWHLHVRVVGRKGAGRTHVHSRQYPNSGNPKIFHGQSWDDSVLGTQWEIKCGVETTSVPPVLHVRTTRSPGPASSRTTRPSRAEPSALYADPAVGWGSGSGTLNTTSVVTQVYLMNGAVPSRPASRGDDRQFDIGCTLDFAMAQRLRQGEARRPYLVKPAHIRCSSPSTARRRTRSHQFGTWGRRQRHHRDHQRRLHHTGPPLDLGQPSSRSTGSS